MPTPPPLPQLPTTAAARIRTAALQLAYAARWDDALDLLDLAPDDEHATLARARIRLEQAFWSGGDVSAAVAPLRALIAGGGSHAAAWEAALLTAESRYYEALGVVLDGGAPPASDDLVAGLRDLVDSAPDPRGRTEAAFFLGVILENLADEPAAALEAYERADPGEELWSSYVLRHRAGHAADAGDSDSAAALAAESLRLRQRTGHLPGALAQLLQVHPDPQVADLVARWADVAGVLVLGRGAAPPDVAE